MELLFVIVVGAGLGAIVRYLLPQRRTYGLFLLPALAGALTAVIWVGLLWLGWKFDGTWIWVVSLGVATLTALAVALVLPRQRISADAQRVTELSHGRA